jgi:CPA2 family monovalent cation:H+ antiporter-2
LLQPPEKGEVPPVVCQINLESLKQRRAAASANIAAPLAPLTEAAPAADNPNSQGIDTEQTVIFMPAAPKNFCSHLDQIRPVVPSARGCEECLASGDTWVHLRLCLSCGHVGCCDSSPNKHATAHFTELNHPLIKSLEPGEDWGWCYQDQTYL